MLKKLSILSILIALTLGQPVIASTLGQPAGALAAEGPEDQLPSPTATDDRQQAAIEGEGKDELQAPEAAWKLQPETPATASAGTPYCPSWSSTTGSETGVGAHCFQARFNLLNLLRQQTTCTYGVCNEQLIIESSCVQEPDGVWVISGHLKYRCWIDF